MSWPADAQRQAGVITHGQLLADGLSRDQVQTLLNAGALVRHRLGVYLVRGAPKSYEARLWITVLALDGVLGFATAGHLWGAVDRPEEIEVIIGRSAHRHRFDGIRIHRIDLNPAYVVRRNGLPTTNRRETLLDHIGRLRASASLQLADRAIQRGWLEPGDLVRRVRTQRGRIGNTRLRELSTIVGDGAAAESERVLHRILRRGRLTGWEANVDVWHEGALIAVVDVAFRRQRLAIEVDGLAFHITPDRFQRDRQRQNDLIGLGWTVLRFTWGDLVDRPGYVVSTIRRNVAK